MTGVGLCLPQLGPHFDAGVVRAFCEAAEGAGYTSLWVQEHFFVPVDPRSGYAGREGLAIPLPYRSTASSLELLSAAAAWTTRPLVGTSVLVQGYHRPVELAQRLATLDVLSGGRLVVGLGVGWSADEHEQMEVAFRRRGDRLEDLVAALRACWSPDPVRYESRFFSVPPSYLNPKPVQARVPILGGAVTPAGCARVARSFDGWNPAGIPPATVAAMAQDLDRQRPPGAKPLSVWLRTFLQPTSGPARAVEDLVEDVRAAREAGFEEVIVDANFAEAIRSPGDWLRVVEELRPLLAEAGGYSAR